MCLEASLDEKNIQQQNESQRKCKTFQKKNKSSSANYKKNLPHKQVS